MSKMISITQDGMILSSEQLHVTDYINITLAAQLNIFNDILNNAKEEDRDEVRGELYDMYNLAASAFLKAFAPDLELRPDLTEEAIMRAENEILKEKAEQVSV
jgi:hypothetical protein